MIILFYRGGLELLLGNVKEHRVTIDDGQGQSAGVSLKQVISWIKVTYRSICF